MPYKFTVFEVVLEKSARKRWWWRVSTKDGRAIMLGSERNRPAAKYYADRALFQLLLTAPNLDASAITRLSFETALILKTSARSGHSVRRQCRLSPMCGLRVGKDFLHIAGWSVQPCLGPLARFT
jgi:hypothetical protein